MALFPEEVLPIQASNRIGTWFLLENFTYLGICGSKLPPKALSYFCPPDIAWSEVLRQFSADVRSSKARKAAVPAWARPLVRFGYVEYLGIESFLYAIRKMVEFGFKEVEWRPFDPQA